MADKSTSMGEENENAKGIFGIKKNNKKELNKKNKKNNSEEIKEKPSNDNEKKIERISNLN
jgi:hypothetical protein